ncbi:neutral/alkaline non-lysosomal ceramidase N-terminal domain-containing protein [Myxococcus fulvus]|uniref:neutral/alkaline non-lysosomal ceramidase N-terminal domain-containing protein n=2 Tax=Myxococcaceae TaxID=31 RepID=UPI001CC007A5|nr:MULTISPECIES: neutral/alkaline non-lysosomal ceramidase N-terminal domain-containing protein [Myxococcus]
MDWWCPAPSSESPRVVAAAAFKGPLQAGAGVEDIIVPLPVASAGYGPLRPSATEATTPLAIRALVLQSGDVRVAIVSAELLTPPSAMRRSLAGLLQELKVTELLVTATHTHSSMGSYEPSSLFQLGGVGRFRPAASQAVIAATSSALRRAVEALTPVSVELGEGSVPDLIVSRGRDEPQADARLTRLVFRHEQRKVAELSIFSAHPTLAPHKSRTLSGDYPGRYSRTMEEEGGVVLFLQGMVGNARAALPPREGDASSRDALFATLLTHAARGIHPTPVPAEGLAYTRVQVKLPRPDASRLVPVGLHGITENALCHLGPRQAEASRLSLGSASLLFMPAEVTLPAGRLIEDAGGATRVISLTGDYIGYLDSPEHVRNQSGESQLQYFGPELLETFVRAAALTTSSLEGPRPP